jgi:hypothetical protein
MRVTSTGPTVAGGIAASPGEPGGRSGDSFGGRFTSAEQRAEAVAFGRNGLDNARLFRVGFDLFPEAADHHDDAAVERSVAPADCGVEQKIAAQHPARPAHKFAQKRKFAARERDRLAGFTL